jgi:hypothetical protein
MEKEWNPNDYQGRREDQYKRNYRILAFLIIVLWLYGMGLLVYELIKFLF